MARIAIGAEHVSEYNLIALNKRKSKDEMSVRL